ALVGPGEADERLHERALARPVVAADAVDLARPDRERHLPQGPDRSIALRELLDLEQRARPRSLRRLLQLSLGHAPRLDEGRRARALRARRQGVRWFSLGLERAELGELGDVGLGDPLLLDLDDRLDLLAEEHGLRRVRGRRGLGERGLRGRAVLGARLDRLDADAEAVAA